LGSLDQARNINQYLNKSSLLGSMGESVKSCERAEHYFNTVTNPLDTMHTTDYQEEYERQLKEQELMLMEQEEQQRQVEKEILREIEEKLERDYKYYQQIKQPESADQAPEESIRKAAENTLDNLCESHARFRSVLTLIKQCFGDYIDVVEQKAKKMEFKNQENQNKCKFL
jgi:uncharacterized membrane protein YheB (UPF0754 family)